MYYIDFDNTLYETGQLTKDVLIALAKTIGDTNKINPSIVLEELNNSFNSTIDNFETFAASLALKYNMKNSILQECLNQIIIIEGKKYVFPDAKKFLKELKDNGETVCILTYVAQEKNLNQQASKLLGSGILPYVNEVYNTTRHKFKLEIDYSNKNFIFIDDSPRDLEGLYNAGARNLIRMKKPNNIKRTSKELNIPTKIPTYTSFDDIPLKIVSQTK